MKFGDTPVDEAAGAILAHSVRTGGVSFKKGRVLTDADVEGLREAGIATVIAARLEAEDVGEDAAAAEQRCRAHSGKALRAADARIKALEQRTLELEAAQKTMEETLEKHVEAVKAADLAPDFARILATRAPASTRDAPTKARGLRRAAASSRTARRAWAFIAARTCGAALRRDHLRFFSVPLAPVAPPAVVALAWFLFVRDA